MNTSDIKEMYDKLYIAYGPQYWWPVTVEGSVIPTYNTGIKLSDKQRYEVALGAVLTQNTNWHNVEKAITNLNISKMLDPELIMNCNDNTLAELIKPSGYFRLKVQRLKSMTRWWLKNHLQLLKENKNIDTMNLWRKSLLDVWGIGCETADSILLYSFDFPTFVIDTYTKRIMNRHLKTSKKIQYEDLRKLFMTGLDEDINIFKEYHALLVKNAKEACKKNECIASCPLKNNSFF